ncbi:MAG: hydroxymethylbilane synthase [Opitutaceae bacterium]|jgi:hydroxymethylbilane synthase|nr:hydroxymethylbilane synthase [Opitutaceae bacterium]
MSPLRIATRQSPLALAQARVVAGLLARAGIASELLPLLTTGDKQAAWSLEQRGGKGLFTSELENALLNNDADLAVHSAKDLPGQNTPGLVLLGYTPRADPRDVLVRRPGPEAPATIATSAPRRRLQLARLFPAARFVEIRGNLHTRLQKIHAPPAERGSLSPLPPRRLVPPRQPAADATLLAAAGLLRLQIMPPGSDNSPAHPGRLFTLLTLDQCVPAVGQAANAIPCRAGKPPFPAELLDAPAQAAVTLERAFQSALGAGCHTAFAAHASDGALRLFHEKTGLLRFPLTRDDLAHPGATAARLLRAAGL